MTKKYGFEHFSIRRGFTWDDYVAFQNEILSQSSELGPDHDYGRDFSWWMLPKSGWGGAWIYSLWIITIALSVHQLAALFSFGGSPLALSPLSPGVVLVSNVSGISLTVMRTVGAKCLMLNVQRSMFNALMFLVYMLIGRVFFNYILLIQPSFTSLLRFMLNLQVMTTTTKTRPHNRPLRRPAVCLQVLSWVRKKSYTKPLTSNWLLNSTLSQRSDCTQRSVFFGIHFGIGFCATSKFQTNLKSSI